MGTLVSGADGLPPGIAKRPITGDHRRQPRRKHARTRQCGRVAVAVKIAGHADTLCMVATKARMAAVVRFKGVDDAMRGQALGCKPAGYIGETAGHGQHDGTDRSEPAWHANATGCRK
jgi:hypothetical protein